VINVLSQRLAPRACLDSRHRLGTLLVDHLKGSRATQATNLEVGTLMVCSLVRAYLAGISQEVV